MEKQFDAASHVLCVVSDEYLKAPYSSWERGAAQWASVTGKPNFVLPVFVEPCKAPKLFAPLKRCDLHGITEDEARTRLKAFLDPAKKPPKGPFPGGTRSRSAPTTTGAAAIVSRYASGTFEHSYQSSFAFFWPWRRAGGDRGSA
jgi:hypothetical protein